MPHGYARGIQDGYGEGRWRTSSARMTSKCLGRARTAPPHCPASRTEPARSSSNARCERKKRRVVVGAGEETDDSPAPPRPPRGGPDLLPIIANVPLGDAGRGGRMGPEPGSLWRREHGRQRRREGVPAVPYSATAWAAHSGRRRAAGVDSPFHSAAGGRGRPWQASGGLRARRAGRGAARDDARPEARAALLLLLLLRCCRRLPRAVGHRGPRHHEGPVRPGADVERLHRWVRWSCGLSLEPEPPEGPPGAAAPVQLPSAVREGAGLPGNTGVLAGFVAPLRAQVGWRGSHSSRRRPRERRRPNPPRPFIMRGRAIESAKRFPFPVLPAGPAAAAMVSTAADHAKW
eukprot:COSAG05_NODE_1788_length_4087_cov_3.154425_3_plen_347_part_00